MNKNNEKYYEKLSEDLCGICYEEFENIKYDVTFFENLLNEYRKLMRKPEPRFEYGGMV